MHQALVAGAGGFIGGHLAKRLTTMCRVRAVDIKPLAEWHQKTSFAENIQLDLQDYRDCRRACEDVTLVFQLAADMGGIGHIETERVACMRNVAINVNMLKAAHQAGVQQYLFSSSACVYNAACQQDPNVTALKESDAFPAMAERGYGWEKLYSEMMTNEYHAEGLIPQTFTPRFHNVYGHLGSWRGGKEKAPAAICRKVAEAKHTGNHVIDIWGDGTATRSFCWIDDCIDGLLRIIACPALVAVPVNLGSSELVSVNQLVDIVEEIAGVKLERRHQLDAPQGVRGRNSDNTLIRQHLGWEPTTPLRRGLEQTYKWIEREYLRTINQP